MYVCMCVCVRVCMPLSLHVAISLYIFTYILPACTACANVGAGLPSCRPGMVGWVERGHWQGSGYSYRVQGPQHSTGPLEIINYLIKFSLHYKYE